MNQKTAKFCLELNEEGMSIGIEGGAQDLSNLIANAIQESEDIEVVVTMALLAVMMKREGEEMMGNEEFLSEMFSKIKPKAQA